MRLFFACMGFRHLTMSHTFYPLTLQFSSFQARSRPGFSDSRPGRFLLPNGKARNGMKKPRSLVRGPGLAKGCFAPNRPSTPIVRGYSRPECRRLGARGLRAVGPLRPGWPDDGPHTRRPSLARGPAFPRHSCDRLDPTLAKASFSRRRKITPPSYPICASSARTRASASSARFSITAW